MSCENVELNGQVFQFDIDNNNIGIMKVSNTLLNTEDRAEELAMSLFLKNSFAKNKVSFVTYVTDHLLNKVIRVDGKDYLITQIITTGDESKITSSISGVRYDG